ncbi:MAG: hypothetical protein U1E05_12285 [Patescibacteria group bacterium]|nr:hypothetical protein [Patescibacteria group bacterium]
MADWGITEKQLKRVMATNMERFIADQRLLVLGQERQWQEEADILALDSEGSLHIFELKRWQSHQENLLPVLRYGQK